MKCEIHWLKYIYDLENADENQIFKYITYHPDSWQLRAVDLRLAADFLEDKILSDSAISEEDGLKSFSLWGPYYMLRGMAIECILKGIIVANNVDIFPNGKLDFFDGKEQNGHDLIRLAERAEFPCSPSDTRLLEILAQHIEWAGRYPTATKAGNTLRLFRPDANQGTKVASKRKPYLKSDLKKIARLSNTLLNLFYEKRALWDQKVKD